jgi:hypothetical protein
MSWGLETKQMNGDEECAAYSAVGRAPHLLKFEFFDPGFVWCDGCTLMGKMDEKRLGVDDSGKRNLDADTVLLNSLSRLNSYFVIRLISY